MRQTSSLPQPEAKSSSPVPTVQQIRTLALNAVEALHGMRPLEPLARLVTSDTYHRLSLQRTLRQERNAVYGDERRIVPMPGRVITSMPHERKMHAVVVMHSGARSFAVVVRLELLEDRWRASELAVL